MSRKHRNGYFEWLKDKGFIFHTHGRHQAWVRERRKEKDLDALEVEENRLREEILGLERDALQQRELLADVKAAQMGLEEKS